MKIPRTIRQSIAPIVAALLLHAGDPALAAPFDSDAALERSQSAIGNVVADLALTDADGEPVRLSDFQGKPVLISLIFTSCHHTCPMTTQHLKTMVDAASERLGKDGFQVLTVGFDTANDTPRALESFRRAQSVNRENWRFVTADSPAIDLLTDDLGFTYAPSPRGFDHLVQLSLLDAERRVVTQIYGVRFELPRLMEPLKRLVFGGQAESSGLMEGLVNRVKLFCTIYNPNTGRYVFDYSLFIQMAIGAMIILGIAVYLFRERRRSRQC